MVVTPKSNGKVRVRVDLSKLKKFVKSAKHLLPAVNPTDLLILCHALKKTANQRFCCVPLVTIMNWSYLFLTKVHLHL